MSYFIRKSHFSLVELSLLANALESARLPLAKKGQTHQENITKTLLKMKASEKEGRLFVAIHDSDPVGFVWEDEGQLITWVHQDHRAQEVEKLLKSHLHGALHS